MHQEILDELREIKRLLALQKKILTLDEFCIYAGISKSYAYHLTSTKKIKCYRPFGKLIYLDTNEMIDFLKQKQSKDKKEIESEVQNYFIKNLKHQL